MLKLLKRLVSLGAFAAIAYAAMVYYPSCRAAVEPRAQVTAVKVQSWSLSEVALVLATDITNPNPLPAPVSDIPCQLTIGGLDLGTAHMPGATTLKANGSTHVDIPLKAPTAQVVALIAQGLERGAVRPYQIHCTIEVSIADRKLGIPFERAGLVDLATHQLLKMDRTPEAP